MTRLRGELSTELTPRERQVLDAFLVDGATNKDLAVAVGISVETVNMHLDAIRRKLGYATRAEMAVMELRKRMTAKTAPEAR